MISDATTPLPHDLEAERAALGAILIRGHVNDVIGTVAVDDFMVPAHREIFESIANLASSRQPIDAVTVAGDLRTRGQLGKLDGAESYLLDLGNAVPTAESGPHYARIVRHKADSRRLIAACSEAISRSSEERVEDVLADLRVALGNLGSVEGGPVTMATALPAHLDLLDQRQRQPAVQVVPAGIRALDGVIGGGHRMGQAVVVAGRPGTGKSAHAFSTLFRAAQEGIPGLFFGLEMSRAEILDRALALRTGIDSARLAAGDLDLDDWKKRINPAAPEMAAMPLTIDDRKLNIDQIVAEAHRWRAKNPGRALIAVDYLGLIRSTGKRHENRQLEVAAWMRELKILAGDLACAVIVVSQLNRESAKGDVPRKPVLSDLRDSGAIEQDADVVIFTWQDGPLSELIVAKNRGGAIGVARVRWDGPRTAYFDDDGDGFAPPADYDRRTGS